MSIIQKQRECGILVTYQCNAACRHCLFACSIERDGRYISSDAAERICTLLREKGSQSVHIGGGEPFLNFDGLIKVVEAVRRSGLEIDYVETNGFWVTDEKQALQYLHALKRAGANKLLISFDPFHAEYVPVKLPLRLAEICQHAGFKYLLWKEQFQTMLDCVEHEKIHSRAELEKLISPCYVLETAHIYRLNMCGRSINIEKEYSPRKPVGEIITKSQPCRNLLKTNFLHVDLYEKYVMPGCTGITIPFAEAVEGIPKGRYIALETLVSNGVAGLLEYAKGIGFEVDEEYTSPCGLCFHIRHWLSETGNYPELDPEHYKAALAHY